MLLSRKVESPRRTPTAAALDAGATIQDALARRLRLARAVSDDAGQRQVLEDRAPIAAVLGRKRWDA
jgi:hypothetical protein